jgi:hypothetical protein
MSFVIDVSAGVTGVIDWGPANNGDCEFDATIIIINNDDSSVPTWATSSVLAPTNQNGYTKRFHQADRSTTDLTTLTTTPEGTFTLTFEMTDTDSPNLIDSTLVTLKLIDDRCTADLTVTSDNVSDQTFTYNVGDADLVIDLPMHVAGNCPTC